MNKIIVGSFYPIAFPALRAWWRIWGTRHVGALVAIYVDDKLLLLRTSYSKEWNLPGGGLSAGETPEQAVRRELGEELGLEVGQLIPAGCCTGVWEGRRDTCYFFELQLDDMPRLKLDQVEILDARLFAKSDLDRLNVTAAVQCYLKRATRIEGWRVRLGTTVVDVV